MEDYKIFSYIDKIIDAYNEPVDILGDGGLTFNHKDTLRTIEFYSNNKFTSGNLDELGREKPFYNVGNYRVTVAKTATDLDVKDIKFEPDALKDSVATMIINRELFKYLKDSNFSKTLNDMGLTRPKYGGLLVKKCMEEGELEIEVVDWKNTDVDPVNIMGGVIIETHWMQPSEVAEKSDVWENTTEVLKAHAKFNKNKPGRIEIKELTGEFPVSFDPNEEANEKNDSKYKSMCFYIAVVGKKKFYLYSEDVKDVEDKYQYLPWDYVPGRGLGKGIIEDGFEAQIWTNDAVISAKRANELSSKVILSTSSQKVSGNAITGVSNGHIFQLEPNAAITALNLGPSKLPEIQSIIEMWDTQYSKTSSTYDANTGEAPTAGTPYSQTALLNQVANSPFEYQREVWGIFLNTILNKWILPYLKKKITKGHTLMTDFDADELKIIDEAIHVRESNQMVKEKFLSGGNPTSEDMAGIKSSIETTLGRHGNKREIEIPEKFLDIEGKITANITGELKNKAAILQSLAQVGKDISSTFNPNTGTYAAMENPFLREIYENIIEISGIPIMSGKLKPSASVQSPMQQPDVSAMQSALPVAPQ